MEIKIDTHTHTIASGHAYNTIREMASMAARKWLEGLAITEHAPKMPGSCGLYYFQNLKVVPRQMENLRLLFGVELNILDENGTVDLPEDTIVYNGPLTNMLVASTPVVSLMNASGCLENIKLVTSDRDSWYIDDVVKAFDDNKLTYVGDYKAPDYEYIVAAAPQLCIYSTMLTSAPETAEKFKELGITYILDQSNYEEHPLGRVEWAKCYAALCNQEEAAAQVYSSQAEYVNELSKAEKTGKSVAVFYITSSGKLYVRNAGDYVAKMVELAGGDYIFDDLNTDKTGTQAMEIESFYDRAKDADYIIYIWSMGGKPSALSDLISYNSVLSDLKAVEDGNVWCTTPDFFQISDTIGRMINDINKMMTADDSVDELTYLIKLK